MEGLFNLYYRKYKTIILPTAILFLSLFVVVRIAIPQIENISQTNQAINQQQVEIENLRKTLETLKDLNDSNLDADLSSAVAALPTSKNIIAIFSSLSDVSSKTNTTIKTFSLKVGDLYSKKKNTVSTGSNSSPFLVVAVNVSAPTSDDLIRFSSEIQESLPIAEVKNISTNGSEGNFEINFFYKPTNLSAVSLTHNIAPLTPKEEELIKKLSSWQTNPK